MSPNPDAFIDPALLDKGKYWSMGAPLISESYSKGNRSNVMGPGRMTSQLEFYRKSKEVAGNISNVVTEYEFKDGAGKASKLWISEEMRQFNIERRVYNEERLWMAEYNRLPNGEITLKDDDNGKPIPTTAGMLEICRESNYDTYGEYLTLSKIKRTIGDVLDRDTDTGEMNIVLMGGKGFIEDFDEAMRLDAKENGFVTPLGDKMIDGSDAGLTYGKYFRRFKTVDGHTITVKHCAFFDKSTIAEAAKRMVKFILVQVILLLRIKLALLISLFMMELRMFELFVKRVKFIRLKYLKVLLIFLHLGVYLKPITFRLKLI